MLQTKRSPPPQSPLGCDRPAALRPAVGGPLVPPESEGSCAHQGTTLPAYVCLSPAVPSCDPGYVASIMGRRRPLPGIRAWDPQLRAQAERQAVNFVVQGTSCSAAGSFASRVFSGCRARGHLRDYPDAISWSHPPWQLLQ